MIDNRKLRSIAQKKRMCLHPLFSNHLRFINILILIKNRNFYIRDKGTLRKPD